MLSFRRRRLIGLVLPFALIGLHLSTSQARAQKVKETVDYSPPAVNLVAEPNVITVCEGQALAPVVQLKAQASSPAGNLIRYSWRTTGGRIEGAGETVTWSLAGLMPGYYRAYVDVDSGSGEELCQAFSSTTVLVNRCPPPIPVCPTVAISCPTNPRLGQPLEFNATVTGGSPNLRIYNWTVSAGTIISGQGTENIKVDTTGLAGSSVRAGLSMGGFSLDCSATCEIQFPVPIKPSKFDEFPDIARNDEKARLDNYAIELHNDPSATGYVFVYPKLQGKPGDAQNRASRIVDYLVTSRGIDARRLVTVIGSSGPELLVELWICPQGCKQPTPTR